MSTRSPAAILFDLTGSAYAVQGNPLHATGSVALTQPVNVQTLPNVSGAVHVTNALLNVTGSVGIGGPVAVQVQNFPATQKTWDSGTQAVSGTVHVTTTGSFPVVVQSLPNVTGAVHVTNAVLNIVGTVGFDNGNGPALISVTSSLPVRVDGGVSVYTQGAQAVSGSVAVTNIPAVTTVSGSVGVYTHGAQNVSGTVAISSVAATVQVTGSVSTHTDGPQLVSGSLRVYTQGAQHVTGAISTYTQGPQLVSGTVYVTGTVATYTHGPQAVTGSVSVHTQGPQNVTGSVSVFTQGAQLVSGTVNVGNWPPVIAVSGSQVTGSTFAGSPVVMGGVSGSTVTVPQVVNNEPTKTSYGMVTRNLEVTRPTFHAVFDRIQPGNNKYMATLWNGASGRKVVVHRIWRFNWQVAAVSGASLDQELRRITARTAGTTIVPVALDTADVLTSGIVADHNSSAVSDNSLLKRITASSEERDAVDMRLSDWLSLTFFALVYERKDYTRGIVLRQNEGLTIKNVTNSTVGTVSYVIEFTDEEA